VLQANNGLWHYRPLELPDAKFTPFPRLTLGLVYRCSAWLTQVWQHYQRVGCVMLYWEVMHERWEAEVPPQKISERSYLCDLTFKGFEPPSRNHLLCGSLSSDSTDDGEDVMGSVPPFDGIHVVQHVQHELLTISAFFRNGEQLFHSESKQWLEQLTDPIWEKWMQRVRLAGSF
jgi:hypothetical protein